MAYRTSLGTEFALKLFYHQRETRPIDPHIFSLGPNWNFNWLSYMDVKDYGNNPLYNNYNTELYGAGGGERSYIYTDPTPDYHSHTVFETIVVGGTVTGFKEVYPNGSQVVYGLLVTVSTAYLEKHAFLTAQIDPQGRTTRQYIYSTNNSTVLLTNVVDCDGNITTLRYANSAFPAQVSEIDSPFSDAVQFKYDNAGRLTNLVDVVGISSSFRYTISNSFPLLTMLTTPYGNTTFDYLNPFGDLYGSPATDGINRAITVTQPDGGKYLYLYRDDSRYLVRNGVSINFLPYCYADAPACAGVPVVGANTYDYPGYGGTGCGCNDDSRYDGVCNHNMYFRDTFYWGPRQYALLSTSDITQLSTNDYRQGRLRNWLHSTVHGVEWLSVSDTLTLERDPSPDGVREGQKTWYGYTGKSYYHWEGTNSMPTWVAVVLPNGQIRYTYRQYDSFENVTLEASTYSVGQTVALRTNTYIYSGDGMDLLQAVGPDGVTNAAYAYNGNHQILFATNALGEVTGYTYNNNGQITSITLPSGLITTNIYDGNGWLITTCDYAIENGSTVYFRTNSYTYSKGLVHTHTDERGLTTLNTWDALQRLRRVDFPDGTFITNSYDKLDLWRVVDRMGHVDACGHDSMRRLTTWTNANGAVTLYNYCTCGSLDSTLDALNHPTLYYYDNNGRLTNAVYPNGYSVINIYNLLGQLVIVQDSNGASTTNWYNNQGRPYAISNAFGQVSALAFDINDRVLNSVGANGVSVSMTYDSLGRVFTRAYPDGGVESFGYSPRGLIAYTNQLNLATRYVYDAMSRKTAETNANLEITRFSYNAAGDLLTLTDGKNQVTTWNYDSYGRVTNKVDATSNPLFVYGYDPDNRLTNRWSAAKGATVYRYDPVGNLTNVAYPASPALSMVYDALNHLTNMVTAGTFTNNYTYDTVGQLLSEGGLWPNDTVSYTYNGQLRNNLSLQQPNASAWTENYFYAAGVRLTAINSPAGAFGYQYLSGIQNLVFSITLPNGAYTYNIYDNVARLTSTFLMNSQGYAMNAHYYVNNVGNQRVQQTFASGDYVNYTYDNIGQLKTATGKESGGTPRLNEQFGYAYDAAQNLNLRTNNALVQTFNVNNLNELTTAGRNGTLTVAGTTFSPATSVTVNGLNAALYHDATFAKDGFTLADGNNTFTAVGHDSQSRQDTATVTAFLPATVNYTYDPNGNLLSNGNRCFAYDDENQLISAWVTNVWRSDFAYDGKLRRRIEKDYSWSGSAWTQTNEVHYVYDGNLVIQERDASNVPQVTYTRGNDLSGRLQGAGGIGGLLARTANPAQTSAYYHADANGNITCLIDSSQAVVARYLYDPFGNTLSASGSMADANLYRFSSKEYHPNSGLVYYLYRFYDPNLQRWLNRDPLDELGFESIQHRLYLKVSKRLQTVRMGESRMGYIFCMNTPLVSYDPLGLDCDCGYWCCVGKVGLCEAALATCIASVPTAYFACQAACAMGPWACAACIASAPGVVAAACDFAYVKCSDAKASGCFPW